MSTAPIPIDRRRLRLRGSYARAERHFRSGRKTTAMAVGSTPSVALSATGGTRAGRHHPQRHAGAWNGTNPTVRSSCTRTADITCPRTSSLSDTRKAAMSNGMTRRPSSAGQVAAARRYSWSHRSARNCATGIATSAVAAPLNPQGVAFTASSHPSDQSPSRSSVVSHGKLLLRRGPAGIFSLVEGRPVTYGSLGLRVWSAST